MEASACRYAKGRAEGGNDLRNGPVRARSDASPLSMNCSVLPATRTGLRTPSSSERSRCYFSPASRNFNARNLYHDKPNMGPDTGASQN